AGPPDLPGDDGIRGAVGRRDAQCVEDLELEGFSDVLDDLRFHRADRQVDGVLPAAVAKDGDLVLFVATLFCFGADLVPPDNRVHVAAFTSWQRASLLF